MIVTVGLDDGRGYIMQAGWGERRMVLTVREPGGSDVSFVGSPADLTALLAAARGAVAEAADAGPRSGYIARVGFAPGVREGVTTP